jgi:deoxycytidine triphosphate deaminase
MAPAVLVLTGTEAAGKSTLADEFVNRLGAIHVVAVTTRDERPDDNGKYRYITPAKFSAHESKNELVVSTEYRTKHYGILKSDLQAAIDSGRQVVLTITPQSVKAFTAGQSSEMDIVSVFLDSDDGALDQRIGERAQNPNAERREVDRSFSGDSTYVIYNSSVDDTFIALEALVNGESRSGILPYQWISKLLRVGLLLEKFDVSNIQAASYDLSLGDEYFYGGRIKKLSSNNPILTIEPYDYAIVTSLERARMPRDIAGRFGLSVGLFSQGVILSNGPQVDPGFEGNLFCLLLNTSSSPVLLRRGQHYATLEFHRILEPSDHPYTGSRQGKESVLDYLPSNAARGAINELKRELEQLRKDSSRLQTFFIAALSLMFAFAAILAATR